MTHINIISNEENFCNFFFSFFTVVRCDMKNPLKRGKLRASLCLSLSLSMPIHYQASSTVLFARKKEEPLAGWIQGKDHCRDCRIYILLIKFNLESKSE